MNTSMKQELTERLVDTIGEHYQDDDTDFSELHFHAFNETPYIIGYYKAAEWLKGHGVDTLDAIAAVIEWECDTFGEVTLKAEDINSESIVNMYVYMLGEELINGLDADLDDTNKKDLIGEIKS